MLAMNGTQPTSDPSRPPRRRDQLGLLAVAVGGLLVGWSYWLYHDGHRGGLIEIDRADPLVARYQVDINRADWPEIIQLPGLGETMARRLLADRAANGPFLDLDDLVRVHGIGPLTLEKVRPYLIPIPKDTDWAAVEPLDQSPARRGKPILPSL